MKIVNLDVLMKRVRTVTARTQSVKSWNPDRGRKIPVRSAAGRTFVELLAELARGLPG